MSAREPRDNYKATVLRILSNFQLLEFMLKVYIGNVYDFISVSVADKVHFGYSITDIENHSLERLLGIFSKFNTNQDLNKRLNKLKEQRNHIAHESLLIVMGTNYDRETTNERHIDFMMLEDELFECLKITIEETKALKTKLG
jgi:hypothetical protein